jgi:hypothetical protein
MDFIFDQVTWHFVAGACLMKGNCSRALFAGRVYSPCLQKREHSDSQPGVPLLAEAAFAGGTERSGQNCAERVGLSAQLAVQL